MTNTVLYGYLIGWGLTTIGLALTIRHSSRPTFVAAVAGAIWPLLMLGAAQFAAVALMTEVARIRERGPRSIDDELEELLDQWLEDELSVTRIS